MSNNRNDDAMNDNVSYFEQMKCWTSEMLDKWEDPRKQLA